MNNEQTLDKKEHLLELVKGFGTGMLATKDADSSIRARPMGVAEVSDSFQLYFPCTIEDDKVKRIAVDPGAAVLFQSTAKWVSLTGTLSVSTDRQLIDRLWSESWKLWFPEGKDDPSLSILIFDPTQGEYWDNSGQRGIRFAIEAAKAYIQGREPDGKKLDENARVKL
jgi:general stress protein 26